ncbi:conserved hypothetical protein [Ricinus communis]|uniref:Uncharacterized protein n=1 Tax=Ricinus communis TaxID=3988 RepID=B9RSD3_RICCO|nr:conserved hypothetical protein [Ricinus communis]
MGGCDDEDYDHEPSPAPKLSLLSLPNKPYEQQQQQPGLLTPPIHAPASVPFKWEEAPGKPRPSCTNNKSNSNNHHPKPKTAKRCLDLPPRLLFEASKVNNIPSPTTVLDGPYMGTTTTRDDHQSLSRSRSLSFGKGRSFIGLQKLNKKGSSRWGSFRKDSNTKEVVCDGSVDFSVPCGFDDGDHGSKVKITRIKRKPSFLTSFSSSSRSHLWEGGDNY